MTGIRLVSARAGLLEIILKPQSAAGLCAVLPLPIKTAGQTAHYRRLGAYPRRASSLVIVRWRASPDSHRHAPPRQGPFPPGRLPSREQRYSCTLNNRITRIIITMPKASTMSPSTQGFIEYPNNDAPSLSPASVGAVPALQRNFSNYVNSISRRIDQGKDHQPARDVT